jgi:DNA-binding helix-hairpin-helix protein with protein kinase domain
MNVYDSRGKPVRLGDSIGKGGEATVYRMVEQPGRLAKIYEPEPRPNYAYKLDWMVTHPPENPTASLSHESLAWPDGLLYDNRRRLKGYRMPHVEKAAPLLEVFNPRRRAVAAVRPPLLAPHGA